MKIRLIMNESFEFINAIVLKDDELLVINGGKVVVNCGYGCGVGCGGECGAGCSGCDTEQPTPPPPDPPTPV